MRVEFVLLATLSTDIKTALKTHIKTAVQSGHSLVIYILVGSFLRVISVGFGVEENRSIFII